MTPFILLKYTHFIGIFLVVGGVFAELWMVKPNLTRKEIKTIGQIDGTYGLGAIITVAAGLTLWLSDIGKSAEFYAANGLVYWKLAIFTVVGLLSIYPTIFFAKEKHGKKHPDMAEVVTVAKSIKLVIMLEFILLLIMPLLASLMAQGLSF